MTFADLALPAIGAVLVIGAYARDRLDRAAQKLRLEMADRGERFLKQDGLPQRVRDDVNFMLDGAFGYFWPMVVMPFVAPFAMFWVLRKNGPLARDAVARRKLAPAQRAEYDAISSINMRVLFANHPFLVVIVELEMLILFAPFVLLMAFFKGDLMPAVTQAAMFSALEAQAVPAFVRRERHRFHDHTTHQPA